MLVQAPIIRVILLILFILFVALLIFLFDIWLKSIRFFLMNLLFNQLNLIIEILLPLQVSLEELI